MEITLNKRFRREVETAWHFGLVVLPLHLIISSGLSASWVNASLILLGVVLMIILTMMKSAVNKITVIDDQTIEKYWTTFGLDFHKTTIVKEDVQNIYTGQLESRHYALRMTLVNGEEILLLDSVTKKDFKKSLGLFRQKTVGTTFFDNLPMQ